MLQRITLVTEDRPGLLAHITGLLAERHLDIKSVVADSIGGSGILHIDLENADDALAVLAAAGYNAVTNDVVLVRVEDRPGALAKLSQRLMDADIAIRALNMVQRAEGWAVVAVSTHDNAGARRLLDADLITR
jgi:hypothetical protein